MFTLKLTRFLGFPSVHNPPVPAVRSAYGPEVGEGRGSVVVGGGGGGQAAGVGGVRGLAGRGGVVCQSESSVVNGAAAWLENTWAAGPYLSWQGGRGTRGFPRTGSTGRAPVASWERRPWSWAAGFYRTPD